MPLTIIRNDIARVPADVIVCSANPEPECGGSGEEAIYRRAGYEKLLQARKKIGFIKTGDVQVTDAYGLDAKYIFHTVSPVWTDGGHHEAEILAGCYRKCLEKAVSLHCESIAFPLLASGTFRFPKDLALLTARQTISDFLNEQDLDVLLVVFDKSAFRISQKIESDIRSFIDDSYAEMYSTAESVSLPKSADAPRRRKNRGFSPGSIFRPSAHKQEIPFEEAVSYPISLQERMAAQAETFSDMLLRLIDERELRDSDVYRKANIDRKLFSKIRSNPSYHPKKNTVIAFALALELSFHDTKELMRSAGYAFSPSSKADIIIQYCMERGIYNVYEVNEILFKFDQPLLGN
ncbi:MAG: macro domain-containing protein [Solobacterium sp.]|nr:macro domain-containing protein [Solobacterium sp.]